MIELSLEKELTGAEGKLNLSIDLSVSPGEFIAVYGKSGAGKTTFLKMLAGLCQPDAGKIMVDNKCWFDSQKVINLETKHRSIGFVFQQYNLFPNMSIRKNLLFAMNKTSLDDFSRELIEITEIGALLDRYPDTLSGGQCQRVALIRALVRRPKLFLLDEPLSALDPYIRSRLQDILASIHRKMGGITIMVSHELSEIFKLANKVFWLKDGAVVRSGPPANLFIEKKISTKVKLNGEILKIEKNDAVYIITVQIGSQITQLVENDITAISQLQVGDRILIAVKAFNPIIIKLSS